MPIRVRCPSCRRYFWADDEVLEERDIEGVMGEVFRYESCPVCGHDEAEVLSLNWKKG